MVVASGTISFSKEMSIRKRIASIYNKREEDFESLREFNDYLEEVEDMIVNLVDGVNVPAIEAKVSQYQKENAEQIINAQARKAEEYAAALAASKGHLTNTSVEPVLCVDGEKPTSSQVGTSNSGAGQYAPAMAVAGIGQPRPMGMGLQPIPLGSGFDMSGNEYEDDETMKIRVEKAARASGWSVDISRKRALEEAFSSIWV